MRKKKNLALSILLETNSGPGETKKKKKIKESLIFLI